MISYAISLSLVSEPSAISSVVFRPSRDVPSLLQTDWALWSKALLKAMGLSSSAVYNTSWEIYFPNNCGVLNSNCFTLAVGKEYTEIVIVNQMICRSLEHSILCEPYNLPPWRHVAFSVVLCLLQDKVILHASVGLLIHSLRISIPKNLGILWIAHSGLNFDISILPRCIICMDLTKIQYSCVSVEVLPSI